MVTTTFTPRASLKCRGSKRKGTYNCGMRLEPVTSTGAPAAAEPQSKYPTAFPTRDGTAYPTTPYPTAYPTPTSATGGEGRDGEIASDWTGDSYQTLDYSFGRLWFSCERGGAVRFSYSAQYDEGTLKRHGGFRLSPKTFFPGGTDTNSDGERCQQRNGECAARNFTPPLVLALRLCPPAPPFPRRRQGVPSLVHHSAGFSNQDQSGQESV